MAIIQKIGDVFSRIKQYIRTLELWLGQLPFIGVLITAAKKDEKEHGKDMAASVAFFTFLSLFPLILGVLSIGGYVLKSNDMAMRVNQFIVGLIPVSSSVVTKIIDSLVQIRGTTGVSSILVLIWSGRKMVGALSRAINLSLGMKANGATFLSTLRDFALTIVATVLITIIIALSPVFELLANSQSIFLGKQASAVLSIFSHNLSSLVLTFVLVSMVYRLIPHRTLGFRSLLPGILTATFLIEVGKAFFVWYVDRASNYSAVYGSLSSIVVLMIWLYFSSYSVLFGVQIISVNRAK
ncbi:YihY/virulence factor BrkB family protein [Thalassotalea sp. LPB0316]|uniref:YihY/virulence factor BrkB family protein n=1 Tax=Thalassotalea sp. LPB0316 TaxID=2769490 RepID=UPI001868450D|nr:YihY/virulence factor BrkB family protein [Thalassotalea sp. LPB0316]QOL25403.1 YihY/virulence factor BrkB family protein [Thalassotalea sp. LPB0316]